MPKKLRLDDLKVQSFVTTLNADQANQIVGGTAGDTTCDTSQTVCFCTKTEACGGCTQASECCDTSGNCTQNCTGTVDTGDFCCMGTSLNCTYDFSYCNC